MFKFSSSELVSRVNFDYPIPMETIKFWSFKRVCFASALGGTIILSNWAKDTS